MKRLWTLVCALIAIGGISAQNLKSPNGEFTLQFTVSDKGAPTYTLDYKGTQVVKPSTLGFELNAILMELQHLLMIFLLNLILKRMIYLPISTMVLKS